MTHKVVGSIGKRPWNSGLQESLNIKTSVGYSVRAWKIRLLRAVQRTEACLVKFQKEV